MAWFEGDMIDRDWYNGVLGVLVIEIKAIIYRTITGGDIALVGLSLCLNGCANVLKLSLGVQARQRHAAECG